MKSFGCVKMLESTKSSPNFQILKKFPSWQMRGGLTQKHPNTGQNSMPNLVIYSVCFDLYIYRYNDDDMTEFISKYFPKKLKKIRNI